MTFSRFSRPVWGWAFYDFANSAYATSILAVLFSVYLTTHLVPEEGVFIFGRLIPGESVWGYLISLVMACVIFFAPSLGAYADTYRKKRPFLIFWTTAGCISTMFLLGATPGNLTFALVMVFLATMGYEMSTVFYNAFINDIAQTNEKGRVSGLGFSLGYIGGGLCLSLNMLMIAKPQWFGMLEDSTWPYRLSFFIVGLWWLLFSMPAFFWLKETKVKEDNAPKKSVISAIAHSMRQLKTTLLWVSKKKDLARFLIAYVIYNDGIQTVLLMASIFGAKELKMSAWELGICFLVIQKVAFVGAGITGVLADKWGHKKVVISTLIVYTAVVTWALFITTSLQYWILGIVVGFVLGGSQSATRSLFATLIPPHKSGELFAFYGVVGKAAALIGPFTFAWVSQMFNLRAGVGSLLVFFVIGGAVLLLVNEKRGRQAAQTL